MPSPTTRIETLDSFKRALREAKSANAARVSQVLGMPPSPLLVDNSDEPLTLEDKRKLANAELKDAIGELLGGSTGTYQTDPVLQLICAQGDFMARIHRAKVLRELSYVRRVAHCVQRRQAYSDPSGYVDRRVETPVTDLLGRANQ